MSRTDPLTSRPTFMQQVRERLEKGRTEYKDRSFSADPAELLGELEQEALNLAGWSFVLWSRLEAMRAAVASLDMDTETPA